jgi:zinc-ribbon domain
MYSCLQASLELGKTEKILILVFIFAFEQMGSMPVVCSVDGIEAEFELFPQIGGNKKCSISLRNQKNKLNLKRASAGEGFAQYLFVHDRGAKMGPGQTTRWEAQTALAGETPVKFSTSDFGSGGESIQITLGENNSQLFPCSGFVRGNLEGTIRAPALHLKMMGKDIWVFFLYFENDSTSGGYRIQCEKDSLEVAHGSSSASATVKAVDGNPPGLLASLTTSGTDYKKIKLILDRAIGRDSLQDSIQQELTVLTQGEGGFKEASWAPVKGNGVEVLWIFSSGFLSHRGPLKDVLEALGAQVNRSVFADGFGGKQMDDLIIADDPTMGYQIGLKMEHGLTNAEVYDWAPFEFVKIDALPQQKDQAEEAQKQQRSVSPYALTGAAPASDPSVSASFPATVESKFCSRCGSKISESAQFCTHCGQKQS